MSETAVFLRPDQVLLQRRDSEQTRNGDMAFVDAAIGQDQDVGAVAIRPIRFDKQMVDGVFERHAPVKQRR